MASQFAKQIATLVAEALQEGPQKIPADPAQEPKGRVCKDGKRKDIAFPSKAQVQKTMSAKAPLSKSVSKFKISFPSDSTVKLVPAAKLPRPPASSSMQRAGYWSSSSSPDSLSPRSPRLIAHSPTKKRRSQRLFSSPESSFRDSGDADDELSYPKRLSTNVTEIRGPTKPWKLTPTKGVLFSNPVYLRSPTKASAPRPSPVKPTSTSTRRRSWLPNQKEESSTKRRSNASLTSSISKVTFKREGPGSTKRDHRVTTTTMFEALKLKSPIRPPAESPARPVRASRRLMPLDANTGLTGKPAVIASKNQIAKDLVETLAGEHDEALKASGVDESSDKENAPVPSCGPAVMFLRSLSSAHPLNRTLSRKNSGTLLMSHVCENMSLPCRNDMYC
jgi:hypothetical protein